MSNIDFSFIGWCKEANHDKVWTSFFAEGAWYSAWGRRGAKLQFKKYHSRIEMQSVERKKRLKYKEVDAFLLFTLFPDFEDKVGEELLMKTLMGKVI
jgi:hypothetical protein